MSDWNDKQARKDGTWRFLKRLDTEPQLRQDCIKYPWIARKILEEAGGFDNMPPSVEIRVMENNKGARDNLHIIALPEAGQLKDAVDFEPNDVWLGCWNLWKQ